MAQIDPELVRGIALSRGASACGLIPASALAEYARFREAAAGGPPDLAYLRREPSKRADVRDWFPAAGSVLVCAFRYWGPEHGYASALEKAGEPAAYLSAAGRKLRPEFLAAAAGRGSRARIARYALGPDYHRTIREKLDLMLADIVKARPGTEGRPFVDTSPVLEKELGRLAGLGFRGRNTLLVSAELGSYFFLGGLALSAGVPRSGEVSAVPGGCGECRKCIEACPTGALKDPGILDASLCVSYWTTQAKEPPPAYVLDRSGGYVYGCDLCQEVCPYNRAGGGKAQ